jgi:hypothetical protein
MITQEKKPDTDPTKKPPDTFFPCLRCATPKKMGSSLFWAWPGTDQLFCDRCIPHPGTEQCEIFGVELNENFQWVIERLSAPKVAEPEKIDVATEQELRDYVPLADEYFRCMTCQQMVSQFGIFDHSCHPASWKA